MMASFYSSSRHFLIIIPHITSKRVNVATKNRHVRQNYVCKTISSDFQVYNHTYHRNVTMLKQAKIQGYALFCQFKTSHHGLAFQIQISNWVYPRGKCHKIVHEGDKSCFSRGYTKLRISDIQLISNEKGIYKSKEETMVSIIMLFLQLLHFFYIIFLLYVVI